jgi:hypothetical protein
LWKEFTLLPRDGDDVMKGDATGRKPLIGA